MINKKSIKPRNKKGQRHGYWEVYFAGTLMFKCFYQNGERVGYEEWYDGKLKEKRYNL
jgi:hypothetical protein